MSKWLDGISGFKLSLESRDSAHKAMPRVRALIEAKVRCQLIGRCNAGAGDAVIETQDPNPSAIKDVVHGGVFRRIGRSFIRAGPGRSCDSGKVTVQSLCCRIVRKRRFSKSERIVKQSAWPCGIDQKLCVDRECCAIPDSAKSCARFTTDDLIDFHFVEIIDADLLRLFDKKRVEAGSEPVRVGDFIVRARGDKELIVAERVLIVEPVELMAIERESALKAASDLREASLPAPPFCERCDSSQIIAAAKLFKQKIRQRRR